MVKAGRVVKMVKLVKAMKAGRVVKMAKLVKVVKAVGLLLW
jgi:hypothetical protein